MERTCSTQHHDIQPPRHQRFLDLNYNREIREAGRTRGRETGKRWSREAGEKWSRIEYLLSSQDKSQQQLLAALHVNRSAYSNWKQGRSKSYLKRIDEIAEFLDVSPVYLLRGITPREDEVERSAAEDEMIRIFRQLSETRQELMIQIGRTLMREE